MLHPDGDCANARQHDKSLNKARRTSHYLRDALRFGTESVHAFAAAPWAHQKEAIMTAGEVLDIGAEAIWVMLGMAAPVMLIGLAVGVLIALFQALTQVQEMTLVFVPKIIVIFLALLIFLPMMGALLAGFMQTIADRIIAG
jgi:flagellar biosynthetic protein FliQ